MSNFETILEIIRKKVTIYYIYWNPYIAEKGHFCFDRIPLKWDKRLLPCSLRGARKWLALVLFKYLCIDFMFTLKVQTFIWQKKKDCWRCLLNNHYYDDSTDSTMIIQQNSTALMGKKTAHEAEGHLGSGTIFLVKAWTLFHSGVCTCALTDSSAYLLWVFLESLVGKLNSAPSRRLLYPAGKFQWQWNWRIMKGLNIIWARVEFCNWTSALTTDCP